MVEGDETVTAALMPDPAYTILSPSNAVLTITDAGTNQTPFVIITKPVGETGLPLGTNAASCCNATVIDNSRTNTADVDRAERTGQLGL